MKNNKLKSLKNILSEIIWLFVIGCILGFILETLWYLIKNGVWINKQGLIYGPFKPMYGTGLIVIVLIMRNFQDKKLWQKFLLGIIIGSAFEYIGSLFQEVAFGTSTWDYSKFNYNISGRIYLPYCIAWGFITIICMEYLYPWFEKWHAKLINNNIGKNITILVWIFMIINILLTTLATLRYSERANNIERTSTVFKFIDKQYNDEYMKLKFPKLFIIGK